MLKSPKKTVSINVGDLRGWQYTFGQGGGLPMHVHSVHDAHITIIQSGSIKITLNGKQITLTVPAIFDFAPGEPHEIEAIDDNTVILNLIKTKPSY